MEFTTKYLNSTTINQSFRPTFFAISRGIIAVVLSVLIIFVNILTILVIKHTTALQEVSGHFMTSLAVADLCVGLVIPMFVYPVVTETWPFPGKLCEIIAFVFHTCLAVSIWSLACLSIDRYIALKKPFRYYSLVTSQKGYVVIGLVWLSAGSVFVLPLFGVDHYGFHSRELVCGFDNQLGFTFSIIVFLYVAPPFVIMYTFNGMIAQIAFAEIRVIKHLKEEIGQQVMRSIRRMNFRASRTLALIVLTFTITWGPCLVCNTLQSMSSFRLPLPWEYILLWIGISNSCLNFFIYNCNNKHFCAAAKNILSCRHPKRYYQIGSTSGTNSFASPQVLAKKRKKSLTSVNNSRRLSKESQWHNILTNHKKVATINIGIEVATQDSLKAAHRIHIKTEESEARTQC